MMLYLVALHNGSRIGDGILNMGSSREALEAYLERYQADLNTRYPLSEEMKKRHNAIWTHVIVTEEELNALPKKETY